jgi:glutamate-1-semialdehyde 2,1-aminomutase
VEYHDLDSVTGWSEMDLRDEATTRPEDSVPELAEADLDPRVDDTARLVARSRRVLSNGELAMSARPLLFGEDGVYPQFITAAQGCRFRDTTGREYVDWVVGWGTCLLGYGCRETEDAVRRQLASAPTLTLPSALEVEVAERLVGMIPCAEMVAFGKNGSDAVTAAVRLARAVTERDVILQYGFHGFHDWFAAEDRKIRGLPKAYRGLVHAFAYNDVASLEKLLRRHRGKVAAVVMEPFRCELPRDRFLEQVKELAHRNGALLVYDEMITGFRVARGGAQEATGVVPDLACYGKTLSNGMPITALVGPRELMRGADSVGVDMGCRGETLSLAAARAALEVYATRPVAEEIARIGTWIRHALEEVAAAEGVPLRLVGHPARLELEFDDFRSLERNVALGIFVQGCFERGVVTNGLVFPTLGHDPAALDRTVRVAREALRLVRTAADGRKSELGPPFGPASIGFLDAAERAGDRLRLTGWLLPLGAPPEAIEVLDHRGRVVPAETRLRPDVARSHPSVPSAERCGWAVEVPSEGGSPGEVWTLRARRGGRVVFRCKLVGGLRDYPRSMPREIRDGHVVEF